MSTEEFRALLARERTIREEQRKQLATAMHNEVSQGLTVLTMELALMQQRLEDREGAKISELLDVVAGVNQAVRRVTGQLYPRVLEEFGLVAALQSECRRMGAEMGITAKLAPDVPDFALNPKVALEIFRLFQEMVLIMCKYTGAKEFVVMLSANKGVLRLSLMPSGAETSVGLPLEKLAIEMNGARERAVWLGGELNVQANRSEGVSTTFEMPIGTKPVTP